MKGKMHTRVVVLAPGVAAVSSPAGTNAVGRTTGGNASLSAPASFTKEPDGVCLGIKYIK